MSKEQVKPSWAARRMAFSMVAPSTNCSPMILTAAPTARRITGSPSRPASRRMKPGRSAPASSSGSISLPVSIRLQVEALTRMDSEAPAWLAQSAEAIFSAISLSRVSSSGVRSRASARHISARPSRVERLNSCRKLSTTPWRRAPRRAARTRAVASSSTAWRSSALRGLVARAAATICRSSANFTRSRCSNDMAGPLAKRQRAARSRFGIVTM